MESYGIFRFIEESMEPQSPSHKAQSEESPVPVHQQNLLTSIRDTRLDTRPRTEIEDDDATESTSRTDDDSVLRDAFSFLHASAVADEDEDEDEIVWDVG